MRNKGVKEQGTRNKGFKEQIRPRAKKRDGSGKELDQGLTQNEVMGTKE